MTLLRSLMVDVKTAWVPYPDLEGFEVEVSHLSRERLVQLRKSCVTTRFDRATRQAYEDLDEKKFVRAFTDATIVNWKGLKLDYLESLMLVKLDGQNPEDELPYEQESAFLLVSNSTEFDRWVNEVVFDLENFRTVRN